MKVHEIMSSSVYLTSPGASLRSTLYHMRRNGVDVIPVVAGCRLVGIVTDSDILRGALPGAKPWTPVRHIMTRDPVSCRVDDDAALAADLMRKRTLKSLPALDGSGRVVGMVSLQDIEVMGLVPLQDIANGSRVNGG